MYVCMYVCMYIYVIQHKKTWFMYLCAQNTPLYITSLFSPSM